MKLNKLFFLVLLGLTVFTGCSAPLSDVDLFEKSYLSVVRVTTLEGRPHGSGFVLQTLRGRKVVITNDHVCAGSNKWLLKFEGLGNTEISSGDFQSNDKIDLCVFTLSPEVSRILTPLVLAEQAKLHEKVYALGYPLEYGLVLSSGFIMSRGVIPIAYGNDNCDNPIYTLFGPMCIKYLEVIKTSTIIYPGNSGSAALNQAGDVIGVFNSGSTDTNFGNYIPLDVLVKFLEDKNV